MNIHFDNRLRVIVHSYVGYLPQSE